MRKFTTTLLTLCFLILLVTNCSKKGCTDPAATNYSSESTKDDGSCLYSPIGEWNIQSYILNGDNLTSAFTVYRITIYSDYSYYSEAQLASTGDWIDVIGMCSFNEAQTVLNMNNSQVNYYAGNGWESNSDWSVFDVNALTSSILNVSLTSSSNSTINSLEIILEK